jgi:hypothetical protein
MTKRAWIVLAIWYACYVACLQFFRFRFGLFPISSAFLIIGILAMIIFAGGRKPN